MRKTGGKVGGRKYVYLCGVVSNCSAIDRGCTWYQGVEMKPTPELRFVEREEFVPHSTSALGVSTGSLRTIRILQQKWSRHHHIETQRVIESEWRDVPLEKEE